MAADTAGRSSILYIINLLSSATPMTLEVPDAPELAGFAVFRSRRVEDGRDRFRLHLGYFESEQEAARVLPVVRRHYPAAFVAHAPADSMGSLDDTSGAQFKLIKMRAPTGNTGKHPVVELPPSAPSTPVAAVPRPAPQPARPVIAPSAHLKPMARPVNTTTRPAEVKPAARPAMPTPAELRPAAVLSLLESAPARRPAAPQLPPPVAANEAGGQKFAVQLVWSTEPVRAAQVPQLAIFQAFMLYAVQVERGGRKWYGLRLGFFKDPISARQVALYARSDFAAAAVIPVSERECQKAEQASLFDNRPVAAATTTKAAPRNVVTPDWARRRNYDDEIQLIPETSTAKAPAPKVPTAPAQQAAARKPQAAVAKAAPANGAKQHPKPLKAMTTQDLIDELGANAIEFDTHQNDELNDSGVRHLSVSVMNRKSPLGRLLARVSGRR